MKPPGPHMPSMSTEGSSRCSQSRTSKHLEVKDPNYSAAARIFEDSAFKRSGASSPMHHTQHPCASFDAWPLPASLSGSETRSVHRSEWAASGLSSLLVSAKSQTWSLSPRHGWDQQVTVRKQSTSSHTWQPSWFSCANDSDTAESSPHGTSWQGPCSPPPQASYTHAAPMATSPMGPADSVDGASVYASISDSMLSHIASEKVRIGPEQESAAAEAARRWAIAELQATMPRGSGSNLQRILQCPKVCLHTVHALGRIHVQIMHGFLPSASWCCVCLRGA